MESVTYRSLRDSKNECCVYLVGVAAIASLVA